MYVILLDFYLKHNYYSVFCTKSESKEKYFVQDPLLKDVETKI